MAGNFKDGTKFGDGLCIPEVTDDITTSAAPSAAECATIFAERIAGGCPDGFLKIVGVVDDAGAGNNAVLTLYDGTSFFFVSLTKAS